MYCQFGTLIILERERERERESFVLKHDTIAVLSTIETKTNKKTKAN